MSGPDFRQQQEQEEHMRALLLCLDRVSTGISDLSDARFLAVELGLNTAYLLNTTRKEMT